MTALGLGDVAAFPFLDPPDARAISDGVALLEELGALDPRPSPADERRLTPLGRRLARLPVDPRLGRMVLEAERHGCVREVLVIAAALSIQDPRERPDRQAAGGRRAPPPLRRARLRLPRPASSCGTTSHEQQQALSSNQFRRLCQAEYLNYLRVREWQDLHSQLRQAAGELGIAPSAERRPTPDQVHRALLAGLLSHIGMRDRETREFRGRPQRPLRSSPPARRWPRSRRAG